MSTPANQDLLDPDAAARRTRTEHRSRQLLGAAARLMDKDGSQAVSMQAVAAEAGVSVGLIYRYFGGKDDLVLAVILGVLDAFAERVPRAIDAAGDNPVERLVAAFRTYCEVIDEHRHAAVLTYRESKSLDSEGKEKIKAMEVATSQPLHDAIRDGVAAGIFVDVDADLVAYNMLLQAHAWALKHWHFERTLGFDDYVSKQTALTLQALLEPRQRRRYQQFLSAR